MRRGRLQHHDTGDSGVRAGCVSADRHRGLLYWQEGSKARI